MLLVAGVLLARALIGTDPGSGGSTDAGPLPLAAVVAPQAQSPACSSLSAALPATLASAGRTIDRLPLADPAPAGAAAWGDRTRDPVVLRCGVQRPAELTPTAQLREISGVSWLPLTDSGAGATTWVLTGRAVFVALTVPDDAGTGPLQDLSAVVDTAVPVAP